MTMISWPIVRSECQLLMVMILLLPSSLETEYSTKPCDHLLMGQYICDTVNLNNNSQPVDDCKLVDEKLQQYKKDINCYPAPQVQCNGRLFNGQTVGFKKSYPCKPNMRNDIALPIKDQDSYVVGRQWRSKKEFKTALLLSIFLGMFGVDRFYLGYPALGLLKLGTFGFMLIGQLIDIILISAQVVTPADGGEYIIDSFGPRLIQTTEDHVYPVT